MNNQIEMPSRLSSFGLAAVHAIALLVLYFVPAFICPIFVDFYTRFGIAETPLFLRAHLISDFLAGFAWLFFFLALYYLVGVYRLRRASFRWLPALSNIMLLAVVISGMVYTTWMINPMPFTKPRPAVASDSLDLATAVPSLASAGG